LQFRHLLPLFVLSLPLRLSAQAPADSVVTPDPRRIVGVTLDRRDIFDPNERGFLARVGNALHVETRAATIIAATGRGTTWLAR